MATKLRRSNIDASLGAVEEVERIVAQIRSSWPDVRIIVRAGSGFARDKLMDWCETNKIDYIFGLARNPRLEKKIASALEEACLAGRASGEPARVFRDFMWSTKDTWSRRRRVIGKAEWTLKGSNPRFIVTSLKPKDYGARLCTRTCTARAATWKTGSRNASSISMLIAPAPTQCGPTSSGSP